MAAIVELSGIRKSFGGIHALKGVEFQLRAGEVHALLGENGAGKSTLMRVLGGEHAPDVGTIRVDGDTVAFRGPTEAMAKGIVVIHQEMALAADLSVAENIFLAEIPAIVSWRDLNSRAKQLISQLGFEIRPSALVGDLPPAHQQIVEIAKALSRNARIIVFDEPTAVLSGRDAERLLSIISELRNQGVAIVYISHRLDEVFRIADRMTIMKDGATVGTVDRDSVELEDVIRMMVGRPLSQLFGDDVERSIGTEMLRVEDLSREPRVRGISFSIKAGEIVGLGGLVGAGRTELVRLIFGADKKDSGKIFVKGLEIDPRHPGDAVRAGIGLVPESRKDQGIVLDLPIRVNATMARLAPLVNALGFIRRIEERDTVDKLSKRLRIKAANMDAPVSSLSGGNQQKVRPGQMVSRRRGNSDLRRTDPRCRCRREDRDLFSDQVTCGRGTSRPCHLLGASRTIRALRPDYGDAGRPTDGKPDAHRLHRREDVEAGNDRPQHVRPAQ